MKLYEVKYEEDGLTTKAPGISETEVRVCSLYYAAENHDDVWHAVTEILSGADRRFKSITEVLPLVIVLPGLRTRAEL